MNKRQLPKNVKKDIYLIATTMTIIFFGVWCFFIYGLSRLVQVYSDTNVCLYTITKTLMHITLFFVAHPYQTLFLSIGTTLLVVGGGYYHLNQKKKISIHYQSNLRRVRYIIIAFFYGILTLPMLGIIMTFLELFSQAKYY
jgi:hypothetical protein